MLEYKEVMIVTKELTWNHTKKLPGISNIRFLLRTNFVTHWQFEIADVGCIIIHASKTFPFCYFNSIVILLKVIAFKTLAFGSCLRRPNFVCIHFSDHICFTELGYLCACAILLAYKYLQHLAACMHFIYSIFDIHDF